MRLHRKVRRVCDVGLHMHLSSLPDFAEGMRMFQALLSVTFGSIEGFSKDIRNTVRAAQENTLYSYCLSLLDIKTSLNLHTRTFTPAGLGVFAIKYILQFQMDPRRSSVFYYDPACWHALIALLVALCASLSQAFAMLRCHRFFRLARSMSRLAPASSGTNTGVY